jgi:hypothetical protein
MPRDRWKGEREQKRARKVLPKTKAQDAAASERMIAARQTNSAEERQRLARHHKGNAQLTRFKKTGEGYESPYTGIMLNSAHEFDTFSEFFRDANLQPADIQCKIDKPFEDCRSLQEVRDKIAAEGKFAGQSPTTIKRGKHEFSWMVKLSEDQMKKLREYYLACPEQGRTPGS